MKINGYETELKKEIVSVDSQVYVNREALRNKMFEVNFTYNDLGQSQDGYTFKRKQIDGGLICLYGQK